MLNCRSEVVDRYWNGGFVPDVPAAERKVHRWLWSRRRRDVVFEGSWWDRCTDDEARCHARKLSDSFAELDAEEEAAFEAGLAEV